MPDISYIMTGPTTIPVINPFFPKLEEDKKTSFNQGYVFAYNTPEDGGATQITVEGCSTLGQDRAGLTFYVNIPTSEDKLIYYATLDNAIIEDSLCSIPVCSFNGEGALENVYLRENLHLVPQKYYNTGVAENLYFIKEGYLYNGDFSVSNVVAV